MTLAPTDQLLRLQDALASRYRIERELGAGGMATVYLAHDLKHDREVAIKVLREDLGASLGKERFLREIQIAARLQHPHVLPLYDSGESAGFLYYVMPYVDGLSLREKLAKEGELPIADAVHILRDVADALSEAHRSGVVHRDLKPENVMLRGRHALVTDFGVAKAVSEATGRQTLTTAGVALGTPAYMAPEQATADPHVDHRADVYAFGVLAYELLTGRPPFTGSTPQQVLAAHVTSAAEPVTAHRAHIPPALAALVMVCLEKKPADRPQSAAELVPLLEAVLTPSGGVIPLQRGTGTRRTRVIAIAFAVVLLVTAAVALVLRSGAMPSGAAKHIAVLPFENVSGDSRMEYLAEGMTDDVSAELSRMGVPVMARTSAYTFKGKHPTPQEVGTALHVEYVVQGTVRRAGDRLRVTAELASAADGHVLAPYSGERATRDILAMQNEIVQEIVRAVEPSLRSGSDPAALHQTADPEAHDLYLRGRYAFNQGTRDGLLRSIELYEAALARDPTYARAHAGIAWSLLALADAYVKPKDAYPRAIVEAEKAIALDSALSEGWTAAAQLNVMYQWDLERGKMQYERAQRLNPKDPFAFIVEVGYWTSMGRADRIIAPSRRAMELDPVSAFSHMQMTWAFVLANQPDSAIAESRVIYRLAPDFAFIDALEGYAFGAKGMTMQAESTFKRAEPLIGHRSAGLAWLYASTGRRAQAIALLKELERDYSRTYVVPENIAGVYAALGDTAKMYEWLEKGVELHSAFVVYTPLWPPFRPYRRDPHFKAILRKTNMPENPPR